MINVLKRTIEVHPIRASITIIGIFWTSFFLVQCGGEGNQKPFKAGGVSGKTGFPQLSHKEESRAKKLFIVPPYIQPGNAPDLSIEKKVFIWQTPDIPTSFKFEYSTENEPLKTLVPTVTSITINHKKTLLYRVELEPLKWDTEYTYTLVANDLSIFLGKFRTRTKEPYLQFSVVGDTGVGGAPEALISQQIQSKHPLFLLNLGDIAYPRGTAKNYLEHAFPYYNKIPETPGEGSALMQHIPTYLTFGNHDVKQSTIFTPGQDYNAAFYYFDLPLNGPSLDHIFDIKGDTAMIENFKKISSGHFPKMTNYSFDNGNAHFLVLLGASYIHPLDPKRLKWIEQDLSESKAKWKFVSIHEPLFATKDRYEKQGARLLAPIFQKHHVDIVFSGHVHNYQRSKPLLFTPEPSSYPLPINLVPGRFDLDQQFNGTTQTHPKGVIYIISGAGGAPLNDKEITHQPKIWEPFTQKFIADRYSFSFIQIKEGRFTLQQIDSEGKLIDEFHVTK